VSKINWTHIVVFGVGVVVALALVTCAALVFGITTWLTTGGVGAGRSYLDLEEPSVHNGRQIYFTATSQRGTLITSDMGIGMGMGMMRGAMMACADCHGNDGRGGRVQMMMRILDIPDIRYHTLTSTEHGGEMGHDPFTDADIRRAITQGVEPDGEPLDWPMPRWRMSERDLDDLLEYLKTLE
jgi:cytochrome c oxidase subunit 2